jgi:hypothetical protein
MGVGFVNHFERYDKPWINGRARSMNLWLDWALMRHNMSQIGVTNTCIAREDYTMHGLHLSTLGRRGSCNLLLRGWVVVMRQV